MQSSGGYFPKVVQVYDKNINSENTERYEILDSENIIIRIIYLYSFILDIINRKGLKNLDTKERMKLFNYLLNDNEVEDYFKRNKENHQLILAFSLWCIGSIKKILNISNDFVYEGNIFKKHIINKIKNDDYYFNLNSHSTYTLNALQNKLLSILAKDERKQIRENYKLLLNRMENLNVFNF